MRNSVSPPDVIVRMVNTWLGKRALEIQRGTPLGVWVVGLGGENQARYVPVNVFLRDCLVSYPADEMAYFKREMASLDPSSELMVMFIIDDDTQALYRHKVTE